MVAGGRLHRAGSFPQNKARGRRCNQRNDDSTETRQQCHRYVATTAMFVLTNNCFRTSEAIMAAAVVVICGWKVTLSHLHKNKIVQIVLGLVGWVGGGIIP